MQSTIACGAVARVTSSVALAIPALLGLVASGAAFAQSNDPVVFSFATVGDSRQDPVSADPTTLLSTGSGQGLPSLTGTLLPQDAYYLQNSAAWATIQAGILSQAPNLLFFNGDMIYGYGRPTLPTLWTTTNTTTGVVAGKPSTWTGSQTVSADAISDFLQYGYWRGSVANFFANGTYVIPVPGNHETQCSQTAAPYSSGTKNSGCVSTKTAYADNENMFRYTMSDLVGDLVTNYRFSQVSGYMAQNTNITTPPAASTYNGQITGSQTDLSYSFDIQLNGAQILHFVVINTDPSGADATPPADWVAADLAAAQTRGATKYFVFGHKAGFTYQYGGHGAIAAGGLDANTSYVAGAVNPLDNFWSTLVQYHATYFAGHEHVVNVQQIPDPLHVNPGTAFQVIVGAGGSPFDDKLIGTCTASSFGAGNGCTEPATSVPYDRYYGWAYVQVHASGLVTLSMTGFADTTIGAVSGGPTTDMAIYDVPNTMGFFPGVTSLQ